MNDTERELWVNNEETLYNWWKSTRQSLRAFVRGNRKIIDGIIDSVIHRHDPSD